MASGSSNSGRRVVNFTARSRSPSSVTSVCTYDPNTTISVITYGLPSSALYASARSITLASSLSARARGIGLRNDAIVSATAGQGRVPLLIAAAPLRVAQLKEAGVGELKQHGHGDLHRQPDAVGHPLGRTPRVVACAHNLPRHQWVHTGDWHPPLQPHVTSIPRTTDRRGTSTPIAEVGGHGQLTSATVASTTRLRP